MTPETPGSGGRRTGTRGPRRRRRPPACAQFSGQAVEAVVYASGEDRRVDRTPVAFLEHAGAAGDRDADDQT
jgi:hypothetical protein